MSNPFIGEITIFAGNFAPRNWAFCNGQLLNIAQNSALFSILGTTYGGDGRTDFGLPDLEGRAAMHPGSGPGLTSRRLGERGGVTKVTLTSAQIPAHSHSVTASNAAADSGDPAGRFPANTGSVNRYASSTDIDDMTELLAVGASSVQPHENRQPYQGLNYIIALIGTFPSRN